MNDIRTVSKQCGAVTIFISMILLFLITVLVLTAYAISTVNLRAVGNVQVREEALAAANMMIENTIRNNFWTWTTRDDWVDLNLDTVDDYFVELQTPLCIRATQASGSTSSSVSLPGMTSVDSWQTVWELDVTATETATGANVRVVQGVRLLLSTALKDTYCPPP